MMHESDNPGIALARQLARQSDLDIALRKDQDRREKEARAMSTPSATPRLDRIRPRVLRTLHVYGWGSFEISQIGQTFTVHARLSVDGHPQLRATLRFTEGGTATMEGSGGSTAVADLRAEMHKNAALAAALEGVL